MICKSLPKLLGMVNVEYEIHIIEAELLHHRRKTRIFVLLKYKQILPLLKRSVKENCIRGDT